MSLATAKLADVAPAKALKKKIRDASELTWHLNLDQVESQTGRVIAEQIAPISEAGNSTHWFDDRHVLYSKLRPYLNKVVVPEKEGIATTELVPMLPDPLRLERTYLAHYLRSNQFVNWVSEQVAGAKMPRVSMKVFWDHEIHLPPLAEQKRIAAILDKADALRRKRQQAIDLADQFLRSVFLDMFGDPVTNPKGWPLESLTDFGQFKNGLNYSKSESGHNVYCIGVGDFKAFDRLVGVDALSSIQLDELPDEGYLLEDGDLLFVRSNGNKALVGRCLTVHPNENNVTFSGFCIRYRPADRDQLNSDYLNYCMRMPSMKNAMLKGGQGANIQNISQKTLSSLLIPLPPAELQRKFAHVVQNFRAAQEKAHKAFEKGNDLFNSLSQQAFAGTP